MDCKKSSPGFALQFYTRDSDFAFIYFNVRFAYVAFLYSGIYVMLQKQQVTTWYLKLIWGSSRSAR